MPSSHRHRSRSEKQTEEKKKKKSSRGSESTGRSSLKREEYDEDPPVYGRKTNASLMDDSDNGMDEDGSMHSKQDSRESPSNKREENIFTRSIPAPPLASHEDDDGDVYRDISRFLSSGSWKKLYQALLKMKEEDPRTLTEILSTPSGDRQSTILQTAVWMAPVALSKFILDLTPTSSYMNRDIDGNTALHLCCANLEVSYNGKLDLSALRELVQAAPRALQLPNDEGDTPLHLLMASPACTAPTTDFSLEAAAEAAVGLLIEASVESAIIQDNTGATPLHVAISHKAHERCIIRLLEIAPIAAKVMDEKGMLALHYVGAFGASQGAVLKLVNAYPEAISQRTNYGDTPLHLLISNYPSDDGTAKLDRNSTKMIELLMGMGQEDEDEPSPIETGAQTSPVMIVNDEKVSRGKCMALRWMQILLRRLCSHLLKQLTPLHCCAIFDAPPQVTRLLMKNPMAHQAAAMSNMFGATALHLACAQQSVAQSIANVMALGTTDAAAAEDRLKRTPLHVASQNSHATAQLIKILCELNPEAASVRTQRGHLPLHLAAQSKAKEVVMKALIRAYPKATEARNKSSNTPLHDAAKYRASPGVVKLLLDTYPDAVYIQNQYGNLPLHCATAYQAPPEVVQLLLQAWPDGSAMQNRNQDAPLHYAAAYTTSAKAIQPLIDAAPAAVLLLNSSGQSPIDRAKANNAPSEINDLLEESAEEWTKRAATDGWGAFSADFEDGF